MNLPNKLTMLRVLLIPVFMVCAANRWMLAAGIIFAAASLTDYFDGHLARKNNLVTDFGKFADPLADKPRDHPPQESLEDSGTRFPAHPVHLSDILRGDILRFLYHGYVPGMSFLQRLQHLTRQFVKRDNQSIMQRLQCLDHLVPGGVILYRLAHQHHVLAFPALHVFFGGSGYGKQEHG